MFKINQPYKHKNTGGLILPIHSFKSLHNQCDNDDYIICLEGYDISLLPVVGLTTEAFNVNRLTKGDYSQILNTYKHNQVLDHNEVGTFIPILLLDNFSIIDTPYEYGKCYYNSFQNDIMYISQQYKDNFYLVCYTRMVVDVNRIVINEYSRHTPLGYNFMFMSDFNKYNGWVEVPKLYFDISAGVHGGDFDILDRMLLTHKRHIIMDKLLKK